MDTIQIDLFTDGLKKSVYAMEYYSALRKEVNPVVYHNVNEPG